VFEFKLGDHFLILLSLLVFEFKLRTLVLLLRIWELEKFSFVSNLYFRIFMFRRTHFPRCCSVPLPECPEHSMRNTLPQRLWQGVGGARGRALLQSYTLVYSCWGCWHPSPSALCAILYHKDFDRGESARPRAPSRLDGLVHSCRGYTLTEKDGLVYSCWGYTLTEKDVCSLFCKLQTQPLFFSALFLHCHLRNPIIKCHYWKCSVDRAVTGISARSINV